MTRETIMAGAKRLEQITVIRAWAYGRYGKVITYKTAGNLLDSILSVSAAPPSPDSQRGWKPIESAPKDGTRVLLADPIEGGHEMSVGWWRPYINDSDDAGWMDGTVESWAYEENTILHPTHWQPLPAPPLPLPSGGSDNG